ncbi:hypothetical protein OROMI_010849 [Orobanche minor]
MPSQEILKIRDGTPFGEPSQEILKVRYGTPSEAEEILTYIKNPSKQIGLLVRILFFKIRPSQEILKIRDGTPFEAEEILTYIKNPRNGSICYFSSKLDVPSNVVHKKRLARILFFKIRPSQEILKIRDGTPFEAPSQEILKIRDGTPSEAEEILTYIKSPRNGSVCYFSSKLDVPSNVVWKKRLARILFFKIRPSQEILKIRDGTPFEAEEILTYIKNPRNGSICYFSRKLDVPSNVVQKKRVARILLFKIRPSQEILKIRDGTHLGAEEIMTYIKKPSKRIVQKKRVARILFSKIRPSQEILKIRDGTPLEQAMEEKIGTDSFFKIRPSQEILKIRDGTPFEKKRVARILLFKIRPSQEILKIRDGTHFGAEEILTYIKKPSKRIEPSQEILKIRDGTPFEVEEILTYIKKPSQQIDLLDVPSNVVWKKRLARILFFKIRPSQEILKIRDGTPFEAEEILTYIKSPRNGSICYFSSKLDVPSNVIQKRRVARILFFKIRLSQEILKIRDGTPLEAKEILTYIKKPSKRIDLLLF